MSAALGIERRSDLVLISIAYFSFILLGMPGAIIGIVWSPHMQQTFGLALDAVGVYFLTNTLSYALTSIVIGRVMARFGVGTVLVTACLLSTVSLAGIALAPSWIVVVICGAVVGVASGLLDAGLNVVFAARYGVRLMNWLHACFGIGSTIAPLLATVLLANGLGWQSGYTTIAVLYAVAAILYFLTRERWGVRLDSSQEQDAPTAPIRTTLMLPIVWIGIGMFFLIAALEATTGNWAKPLMQQSRGIEEEIAGIWVGVYWGSFTIGRILFGAVKLSLTAEALLKRMTVVAIFGTLLLWWAPTPIVNLIALLIIGFSVAPMFATLVTNTQTRLGPFHAPNAIGVQVAAASIGIGALSGLAGVIADKVGLEILPPFLLAIGVGFFVLLLLSERVKVAPQ